MHTQQIKNKQSQSSRALNSRALSTAVALLSERVPQLAPSEVLAQGLSLIREHCSAEQVTLYSTRLNRATPLGTSSSPDSFSGSSSGHSLSRNSCSTDWFPWGLHIAEPLRFLFVAGAQMLPVDPISGDTLGQVGLRSCLHLTIRNKYQPIGAIHIFWSEARPEWDDTNGQILRALGSLLLTHSSEAVLAPHLNPPQSVLHD